MRLRHLAAWTAAGLVVAAGVAMRVNNAFRYRIALGFDAPENWRYIERLTKSWQLPAPDVDWATAHPPLFYYLSAAIVRGLGTPGRDTSVIALRLLSAAVGLGAVALAVALVRRTQPTDARRAALAGALLLFLPVHVYMSAMLSEEILVSSLTSLAIAGVCWDLTRAGGPPAGLLRPACWGAAAGLALLTKLTGLLVVAAGAGAYLLHGWRSRGLRSAAARAAVYATLALLVGGWYYARNQVRYGYLYPHGLKTHRIMFTMPPGERRIGDYLRFPLATFRDPQVLAPDLVRSVWGSTYVSIWFDGHRHFLRVADDRVRRAGTLLCLLAILPTAAFLCGLARGVRRAVQRPEGPDPPLLLLTALTLAGYAVFSWRNPWFAVLKGSFLLGLSLPFAFYASETLAGWTRAPRARAAAVAVTLGALFAASGATFTQGLVFSKDDRPGVRWENDPRRRKPRARPTPRAGGDPAAPPAARPRPPAGDAP